MFSSYADNEQGMLVGVYSGLDDGDADHAACIRAISESDAAALRRGIPHVCILVTGQETPQPSAIWRQRMAKANEALGARGYHFALVSPSVVIRGVFTAIQWLTRSPENHQLAAFSTFGAAAAWIRKETGNDYPLLEMLYVRAQDAGRPSKARVATGA